MDEINLEVPLNKKVDQMRWLETQFAHRRGHELKNDGNVGILLQRVLHALANRQFIPLNIDFDEGDIPRLAPRKLSMLTIGTLASFDPGVPNETVR